MSKLKNPVLDVQDVFHGYGHGNTRVDVLQGTSLKVFPGEMVALLGSSGAGKSTILQISGLLEKPEKGHIYIDGEEAKLKSDFQRTTLRRDKIGFVYQFHHLLPDLSAIENIMLPQLIRNVPSEQARAKAEGLLEQIDLTKRAEHRPAELSGGEQQRIAIARALANDPAILIADEPTGNLDPTTGEHVFEMLRQFAQHSQHAFGILIATHNHDLAKRMNRILVINKGRISEKQADEI